VTFAAMMSALGAWILGILSKDALAFVWSLISKTWATYQSEQAAATQAQADAAQLAAAKTTQDKIDAANKINSDTFGGNVP
jgi:hypothetical protein